MPAERSPISSLSRNSSGKIYLGKVLTTPKDPSQGVIDSIAQSRETGLVTTAVSFFVHGGTTVINAITERKGVRTAVVTTDGFRDVIAIGRGNRPDLYNLHSKPPEPFVPRHLRFEVIERIDAMGNVRTPLSMKTVDAAADAIAAAGVEAVAVIFLHAYINPAHEAAAAARLRELLPGVAVTASHEISRQWREYERSNTAVLSAYVQPIIAHYLANLSRSAEGRRRCLSLLLHAVEWRACRLQGSQSGAAGARRIRSGWRRCRISANW